MLVARPRQDGTRRYVCATGSGSDGCGKTTVIADPVEHFIAQAVLHRLETPRLHEARKRTDDAKGAEWQAEIERQQAQLDELAAMWADGEITRGEWMRARTPIEKRLSTAKKKLAALNRTTVLLPFVDDAKALREQWQSMTLTRQHEIVVATLQHVQVRPAVRGRNRFDESRLRPVWRV